MASKGTLALLAAAAGVAIVVASSNDGGNVNTLPRPDDDEDESDGACAGIDSTGGDLEGMRYLEFVTGGAEANEDLPMVIGLHGLGHDKEYLKPKLAGLELPARIIIPDAFYERTGGRKGRKWWRGYHPQGLQAHLAEQMPLVSEKLAPFIDAIARCRPTIGKPIVAGHSAGAYIALDLPATFPELISGAVPINGWRPTALWDAEPRKPVIAVHGRRDDGVDYDRSVEYYEAMMDRGAPLTYVTSNAGHTLTSTNREAWQREIATMMRRANIA